MTIFAPVRNRSISNRRNIVNLNRLMTAGAGHFLVRPLQRIHLVMFSIDWHLVPGVIAVAIGALPNRRQLRKLPDMRIDVARRTGFVPYPEIPIQRAVGRGLRLVAGKAWLGQVCPRQGKFCSIMIGYRIQWRHEALFVVTIVAFAALRPGGKLPPMRIAMTVGAGIMPDFAKQRRSLMALIARYRGMLTYQRESGCTVIEISGPADLLPAGR